MRAPRTAEVISRRILTTIWRAEWWQRLPERPRMLWLRLATAPESTVIPGLALVDVAKIAADLGWSIEEVERISAALPASSCRADWRAGVVWLPPVLGWNPPASPKNVAGWRVAWSSIPDSPVRDEIREDLRLHCAGRCGGFEAAFAAACPVFVRPPPAELPPARIEIRASEGIVVSASGVVDPVATVRAVAASLGVAITLGPAPIPEIVDVVEVMPRERQDPIPALRAFAPAQPAGPKPRTREGKRAAVMAERAAEVERVLAYHQDRRAEAFRFAGRPPAHLDETAAREAIADLLAAGRTVVELETAVDRLFEYVAGATGPAEAAGRASWWSLAKLKPAEIDRLLRQNIGATAPAGVGALVKQINDCRPAGARALTGLSQVDTRPICTLLETGGDPAAILDTMTQLAEVARAQEDDLKRRPLSEGEVRIVKVWGSGLFRLSAWTAAQSVADRWAGGERGPALYLDLSRALGEDEGEAAKSG